MKFLAATALSAALGSSAMAQDRSAVVFSAPSSNSMEDIQAVAPALSRYAQEDIAENLWQRPELSPRDRSIVTVAMLIARGHSSELAHYMSVALDNGVTPAELSEAITHLAFYSSWPNAMVAVTAAKDVFEERNVDAGDLPAASPDLSPLDEPAEEARQAAVQGMLQGTSPGLETFTTDPLFMDVWLRPGLTLRDRSLVTISALMASGQVAQLPGHLNRALDNGLTAEEAGEVVTQAAFYAGWPNAFSAGPVVAEVLTSRQ